MSQNLIHLDIATYPKPHFFQDRNISFSSPNLFSETSFEINNEVQEKNETKNQVKRKFFKSNTKILRIQNRFLHALKKKSAQKKLSSKSNTFFSISSFKSKKLERKTSPNFSNLSPLILNNMKMFFNKIKKWGYLNNLSSLKLEDLKIINDQSYCEPENVSSKVVNAFLSLLLNIQSIVNFLKKLFHFNINKKLLIHPYSKFKLFWDSLNSLLIIFMLFYIPLAFCFQIVIIGESLMKTYLVLVLCDIFIEMNTLYFNYGSEVRDQKLIIYNYFSTSFFADFLALTSICVHILDFDSTPQYLKLLFFAKIFTLFKISKKLNNRFQFNYKMKGIKDLISFFFIMFLVTHLVACSWYFMGSRNVEVEFSKTWLTENNLLGENWQIQYLSSFYWALVTIMTVGYGDITPQNTEEKAYCVFTILFGCLMFPYSINCIGFIIQNMKKDQTRFDNTLDIINGYMTRKGVKPKLQTRIREYLTFMWREEKSQNMEEEEKIIQSLSHSLKEELLIEAYGFFLKNNPLFTKFFSECSLKKLVSSMKEIFLTPGDAIFLQNSEEESPGIYFIGKGIVNLYSEQNKTSILLKKLNEGDYFGERSFFTNFKRENSAISDKFTTLFTIKQDDFIKILKENKEDYENFMMIKEKLVLSNDYSSINKKCFSCGQFNHIIEECPKLHYVPNIEKIINKLNYPFLNERSKFSRLKRKAPNGLLYLKKNQMISQKIQIKLKNLKTIMSDVSSEESEVNEQNVDDIDNDKKRENDDTTLSNKRELFLHTSTLDNFQKVSFCQSKTLTDDNFEKDKNLAPNLDSLDLSPDLKIDFSKKKLVESYKEDQINFKEPNSKEMKDSKDSNAPQENQLKNNSAIQSFNSQSSLEIDKFYNFKNYFPNSNIEKIIENRSKILNLEKELHKRYLKKKYKNMKFYSFYTNEIVERFYKEKKDIRKNKKSLTKKIDPTNTTSIRDSICKKAIHSMRASIYQNQNPGVFFRDESSNKPDQIKSFADLISTLVHNRKVTKIQEANKSQSRIKNV